MSGQHEWGELDQSDQLDPRDATLDLSGLIDRMSQQLRSSGNGKHSAASPRHEAKPEPEAELPEYSPAFAGQHAMPCLDGIATDPQAPPEPAGPAVTGQEPQATADRLEVTEPVQTPPHLPEPQAPMATWPLAVAERPAPGSLADLRQRLERLPYGHPSSPYHVDGERKPPPPRLRHLELAPPTASRFSASAATAFSSPDRPASVTEAIPRAAVTGNGAGHDFAFTGAGAGAGAVEELSTVSSGADPAGPAMDASPAADDEAADLSASDSTSQFPAFGRSVSGSYALELPVSEPIASKPPPPLPPPPPPLTGPPQASAAPEAEPVTSEPPAGEPHDSESPHGQPPPDDARGDDYPQSSEPYERRPDQARRDDLTLNGPALNGSALNGHSANGSDVFGQGPGPSGHGENGRGTASEPPDDQRRNGQLQPSGAGPGGRPVPGLEPATAPASGPRSDYDGSWSWGSARLTADQVRMANEAYDRFRTAEGRNLFGSYSGTGLTTMMRRVAGSTEHARLAPDTEQSALLDPDTFKLRFADMLRRYPDRTADRLARRVPGAISYSFIFEAEHYSAGIWTVQDALSAAGFQLLARRNDWNNPTNRCVATMWHDPANDLPFQVQFHTMASLEAQQLARSSAGSRPQSDLAAAWASLPAPPGNAEISDYRRDSGPARR